MSLVKCLELKQAVNFREVITLRDAMTQTYSTVRLHFVVQLMRGWLGVYVSVSDGEGVRDASQQT